MPAAMLRKANCRTRILFQQLTNLTHEKKGPDIKREELNKCVEEYLNTTGKAIKVLPSVFKPHEQETSPSPPISGEASETRETTSDDPKEEKQINPNEYFPKEEQGVQGKYT
jgi:hypothetical protein